ncbi:MAG: SDR family oxidoreductase [Bacteroidia bacterium]|nr:SDR family oxidoreductase [Bacteroidia bacterium]
MKVFLLGATGNTGFEILKRLVSDQHQVRVLARNPEKLDLSGIAGMQDGQVEKVKGGVFDSELLDAQFKGCEAVISALGTGTSNQYTEIYSQGGRNILAAMRSSGLKKLITVTSGLVDHSDPSTDNFFLNRIIRPNYNKVYYDQTKWETILDDTRDLDWVCVRPPMLTNKPFTGVYRVNLNHVPPGGRKISRADLADFMVKQLDSGEYIRKKPTLAY